MPGVRGHGASDLRSELGSSGIGADCCCQGRFQSYASSPFRVEDGFIEAEAGRHYLPIGLVGLDDAKGLALIELPHESDAGINRLWVRQSVLREITETVS